MARRALRKGHCSHANCTLATVPKNSLAAAQAGADREAELAWKSEIEELRKRRKLAEQMGGPEKVARQHSRGKLDARARIKGLVDPGSFREIGKIAGKGRYDENGDLLDLAPSNLIFGRANIEGRPVVASADDFTVRGGAADAALHRKFVQCEAMAHE